VTTLLLAALLIAPALAQDAPDESPPEEVGEPVSPVPENDVVAWERQGLGFGGLPAVNYNTDEGFGAGALGTLYGYDGATAPYKWKLTALFFLTTNGVHSHYLDLDALELAGGKLRVRSRAKFGATSAENYCGLGSQVTCDEGQAILRADDQGLAEGEDRNTFLRRYYKNRLIEPFWTTNVRYQLRDKPHRVELIAGYRFSWLISGALGEPGPFEGSLYSETFPEGENVRTGVAQLGIMVDNRDNEPSPHSGYWVEATTRGSHPYLGSSPGTGYVGFNANLRGYVPILKEGRLTLANRLIMDAIVGNASTQELSWFGGTQIIQGIGGLNAGRGIRQRRYRAPVKGIEQAELRWRFASVDLGFPLELYLHAFGEVSYVGETERVVDANAPFNADQGPIHFGEGAGLRIVMDKNFIIRLDFGFSGDENNAMGMYIDVDNLF